MNNAQEFIPQSKGDLSRAKAAVDAGYPRVESILPELLEWLQDYNWPVAHVLAPFLASIGDPLVPHVRRILESEDETWKYWMMDCIMKESLVVAESFRDYLERLVKSPSDAELREGLDDVAKEVLETHGWSV